MFLVLFSLFCCCCWCAFFGISFSVFLTLPPKRKSRSFDLCGQNMLLKCGSNVLFFHSTIPFNCCGTHILSPKHTHNLAHSPPRPLCRADSSCVDFNGHSKWMRTFFHFPRYNLMSTWTNRLLFELSTEFIASVWCWITTSNYAKQSKKKWMLLLRLRIDYSSFSFFSLLNGQRKKNKNRKWMKRNSNRNCTKFHVSLCFYLGKMGTQGSAGRKEWAKKNKILS